jgi:Ca2+-binding RTX toxin-like protein
MRREIVITVLRKSPGSAYADNITLAAGTTTANGGDGTDTLTGTSGADTLNGGGDNDVLIGGGGADSLDGGTGTADWVSYITSGTGVTVDLTNTANNTGDAAGDSYANLEKADRL